MSDKQTNQLHHRLTQPHWIGIMAAVGLLLLSVLGLLFVQKPLQETQEIRPEAAVSNGTVSVSTQPNTNMVVGQPSTILLAINTNSVATTGVQLVFNIHSTAGYQNMTAQTLTNSGLQSAYLELEQTSDGALVGVIALPPGGQQFSTAQPTNFLELNFTPTSAGVIRLNFDNERSIVTKYGSNPPEDVLHILSEVSYSVTGTASSPSPSPTATPTISPSPAPTATPNISCNKSCRTNDECPVNYRCYSLGSESRCRLVTNPTSTTCQGQPDQGLNRRCNEYCADSRECSAGLSCWENRCRNPENVDSNSCSALTTTQRQQSAASCNQSCSDNGDCAHNLRCYSGRCRLVSNPSSQSCSAATTPTVSDSYTGSSKGANDGSNATASAIVRPTPPSSPLTALPTNEETNTVNPEETAQETLLSLIANAEYSLPLKVFIAGFILLVIGLLAGGLLSRRRNRFADQLAQPERRPSTPSDPQPPEPQPAPPKPPTPMMPNQQQTFVPQQQSLPEQRPTPIQHPPINNTAPTTPPPPPTASSMLERIKQKGIAQPHQNSE